jgi:hypothetical protein
VLLLGEKMKKLLLVAALLTVASASAYAGRGSWDSCAKENKVGSIGWWNCMNR